MNTTPLYKMFLHETLASDSAQFDDGQLTSILSKFDTLAQTGMSGENVFKILLDSYASVSDSQKTCNFVREAVETAILQANQNTTIETNPVLRLRQKIAAFNKKLGSLAGSVEVNGKLITKDDLEPHMVKVPDCFAYKGQMNFIAYAARDKSKEKFSLTVVF